MLRDRVYQANYATEMQPLDGIHTLRIPRNNLFEYSIPLQPNIKMALSCQEVAEIYIDAESRKFTHLTRAIINQDGFLDDKS